MEVPKELQVAIELAGRTAAGGGRVGVFAKEMARLLAAVEKKLEALDQPAIRSRPIRTGEVEYIVERVGGVDTLAEHRLSGKSKPFRCPKALYEAVAQVLAAADRPLAVEEIASGVEKLSGDRPAEFQLRVPLRLWTSVDPPLATRNRARYRSVDTQSMKKEATAIWERLRPPMHEEK